METNIQDLDFPMEKMMAGGLGAGLNGLLDVPLVSGIDMILETIRFDDLIEDADLIITGEGKIDGQSLGGKAIFGVSKYAKVKNIPLCVITGDALDKELEGAYDIGISGIFPTNRQALPFTGEKQVSEDNLRYTIRNILNFAWAIIN